MRGIPVTLSFQFPSAYGVVDNENGTFTAYVSELRISALFDNLVDALSWLRTQLELEEIRVLWEEYHYGKLEEYIEALEAEIERAQEETHGIRI
jgi:hypothetical protein